MRRIRSRTAAWLALAGMALNAFWPLLANARPNVPALTSEICSVTGLKHAPDEAPGKGVRASHCTLCPFNAERGATIPCAAALVLASTPAAVRESEIAEMRRPQAVLDLTAPPRGPPFLS